MHVAEILYHKDKNIPEQTLRNPEMLKMYKQIPGTSHSYRL